MKKVLLIARAKTEKTKKLAVGFAEKIANLLGDNFEVEQCEISELFFELDPKNIRIYHPDKKFELSQFDLVIIRHVGNYAVEAHAITAYCQALGVKYTDTYLNRLLPDNKLSTQFVLWLGGVKNWPRTFYGPVEEMKRRLSELGDKAVLKDNNGSKGRLNFIVSSAEEVQAIVDQHPESFFVLQEYIPNQGDFRILVFNGTAVLTINRRGDGSTHLNNTSQGGLAAIVPMDEFDSGTLRIAEHTAELMRLQVAGVDVMFDDRTGEAYMLEINNAPQISSGSFVDEKAAVYAEMIRSMVTEGMSI